MCFRPDYVGGSFDTVHKAGAIAASIAESNSAAVDGDAEPPIDIVAPTPASRAELVHIHDEAFVDAVLTGEPHGLAASAGLGWDEDFARAVLAGAGGCRDAAALAWRHGAAGTLSSGLHHARRTHGEGYCTFNGLVLAAQTFLRLGAERVLIVDLDAHCGGGTFDIAGSDRRITQLDVSTSTFDRYVPTAGGAGAGWTLDLIDHAPDYLPTVERRLLERATADAGPVDAVVYNAGMDPHEDCSTGGLHGITTEVLADREEMVFAWAASLGVPIAFALAGGYTGGRLTAHDLTNLHRLTIDAAAAGLTGGGAR